MKTKHEPKRLVRRMPRESTRENIFMWGDFSVEPYRNPCDAES